MKKNYQIPKFNHLFTSLTMCFAFVILVNGQTNAQEKQPFELLVKNQLIADWKRAKLYTEEFLAVMPQDKFKFKPEKDAMSFAEQMMHLAKYNFNLGTAATGAKNPYAGQDIQKLTTQLQPDSVKFYVDRSYDFLITSLEALDSSKLSEQPAGQRMTRFLTLEKAFEHQTHHRGAIAVYIRMVGVKPPHEMLF